jgi:hypothetical protein
MFREGDVGDTCRGSSAQVTESDAPMVHTRRAVNPYATSRNGSLDHEMRQHGMYRVLMRIVMAQLIRIGLNWPRQKSELKLPRDEPQPDVLEPSKFGGILTYMYTDRTSC